MVEKLPEYSAWNALFKEYKEYWQYYKNLYSYALQKPANTFFTSRMYPAFYQERLLKRQYAENMQLIGKVQQEELDLFCSFNPKFYKVYDYFSGGKSSYFSLTGLGTWAFMSLLAQRFAKSSSWLVVPGLMNYIFMVGIQRRGLKLQLGEMVDFTDWILQKRKAKVWAEENQGKFHQMPALPIVQSKLIQLSLNYK